MQQRFSTCRGMPVVHDADGAVLGSLHALLLHPDTGRVEGVFVAMPGFLRANMAFLASADICRWGRAVAVRDADMLGPLEDHVRLARLAETGRRILGQRIVTQSGTPLGRCDDVQFDTRTFQMQWLFPRRFPWRWGVPVPAHAVVEVRPDAVVVRDRDVPGTQEVREADIVAAPTAA